ncbi:hypothetical protein, partial [Candidatus Ulvibacter alkanivorans]|uniref:hypothetical protein n=1 Tax=Candidatus Ulvibacter alkanivorans TaxID=2267620 RepID=UPI001443EB9A
LYAQEQIKYEGGEIYIVAQDNETDKEIFKKPYGKIISIEYDAFYKSYYILFQTQDGATGFGLEFIKEFEVPDGVSFRMKEKGKNNFYDVFDRLEESGIMIIISKEVVDGVYRSYQILNTKKV